MESRPAPLMPTSETDIDMSDNLHTNDEANGQNGTMDPRVLSKGVESLELQDSTQEESSQEESHASSEVATNQLARKVWVPTGFCYDVRMMKHANADSSNSPGHPEAPGRIQAIYQEFKKAGLIYTGDESDLKQILRDSPTRWMWRIPVREALPEEVCLAHTASHFEWVRSLRYKSPAQLRNMTQIFDTGRKSIYVGSLTYESALLAAGGAIETCKNVVAGNVKNAIAIIRPPGHHAEHNEPLGFCFFNNVPIAAKVCMADYPELCRKVLILDWDVHHGNGIQNMFYEDPNVLYISLHVYQDGHFYPGQPEDEDLPDGGLDKCGAGRGQGKNINIGWHEQGMGDGEYMAAFQKIVMPIAQEFDPDLVIISAGFDAAAGDELGGCFVTPPCYSHMTHMLMSLANGKVAVCLEGGYNLKAISRSALAVAKTLMGEPPMRIDIPPLNAQAARVLQQVKICQAPFWQCMRAGVFPTQELQQRGAQNLVRLNDAMRTYQRSILSKRYKMVSLYIQRDKLSRSFEDQVLATPNIYNAKKILLIIHDPPELYATPDAVENTVLAHNTFMTDPTLPYIDWAVTEGYGVLDINIPSHLTQPDDNAPFKPKMKEAELIQQMKDLLCYLWDNYLENYASNAVVVMGVGDAYLGVKQLLTSRDCRFKIPCILAFVTGSLRAVKSETDPHLSTWYRANSLIYVSPNHACWDDEDSARKVRKNRFGNVRMSEVNALSGMMDRYLGETTKWVQDKVGEMADGDETEEDELAGGDGELGKPIGMSRVAGAIM